VGNHDSVTTAFNGDLSKLLFPIEHRITGAASLTQPTTGYVYTPEAYPVYGYLYNESGHNQATATNVGRTAAVFQRVKVFQNGQGDAVAYNGSVFVTGTKSGSTHFLANPAGVLFNGDMTAGAAGVYLNAYETNQLDGGFDAAAIGVVNNFNRTVSTGAKSAVWMGYRAQSTGSASCDAVISATGKWVSGIDFALSTLDLGAGAAAISFKTGQKQYWNSTAGASGNLGADWRTTTFGTAWTAHSSADSEVQHANASAVQFAVGSTASAVNYVQAAGAGTGAFPGLYAKGADTDITLGYRAKGAAGHIFYSAGGSTELFRMASSGAFGITDGIPAPGAIVGRALIYVDAADGDLKVIFGDGTVKTIVSDT
jgi:hypothetical protein